MTQAPRHSFLPRVAALCLLAIADPVRAEEAESVEVEVRGSPVSPASAPKDPSVAASTVRRSELEGPGRSAADVLRGEVGLTIAETGGFGAASTASIRGATAAETPVYLAGVRINDDVAGAADLSTLPLWLIDRVEIYRGNAPLEADRFGIGGAIFFEPLRPREPLVGLGALVGSHRSRAAWTFAASGGPKHRLLLGVRFEGAENDYRFENDRGTLFDASDDRVDRLRNADATVLDVWALGNARLGDGSAELVLNHFEREQGVPRLAHVPTHASRQRSERTLASVATKTPLGEESTIESRTTLLAAETTLDDPLYELSLRTNRQALVGERVEQHLGSRVNVGDMMLRVAFDGGPERLRRYEGVGPSAENAVLDARRISGRLAVHGDFEVFRGISVRPLGALECHDTSIGNGAACDVLEPTGRLGALGVFGEFSAFAGVGRYVRLATLGELHGMSVALRGNPRLESETGTTIDAGARLTHRLDGEVAPLWAAVSAYTRESSELISFVRASQGYVVPVNVGEARVNGLEVEAGAGFLRHFAADAAVTALDARDHTPALMRRNRILPYRSRLVAAVAVRASSGPTGLRFAEKLSLGVRHVYQTSRYADLAGLSVIPEQHGLDADAAISALEGAAVLRTRVTNLLDQNRWDVVGFPLPGRSFFASLEARL